MTRLRPFACTALLMLTCASAAAGGDPEGTTALATMSVEEIDALAREIAPKVEAIRKRSFLRPVPVRIVDDAAARAHFQERLRRFWPEERRILEQTAFAHLGLLPPGYSLGDGLFDVLEEQTGGYYDPQSNTFFVLNDMPRTSAPILIAHELTHALDDQIYGIDAMIAKHTDDSDRSAVVAAVVEGSGTLVMSLFIIQEIAAGRLSPDALLDIQQSEAGRGARLLSAPPLIRRGLLAPYLLGQTLMLRGRAVAGLLGGLQPEDLEHAFRSPPVSTEQLLHPEKYWDPDAIDLPVPVVPGDLSDVLGEGWTLRGEGNLGELNLALLTGAPDLDVTSVEAIDPQAWTNEAATGWGGDRWQLYGDGRRQLTLLCTVWDTPVDADQFAGAIGATDRPGDRAIRSEGKAVVIVAGDSPDDGAAEALALRALKRIATPAPSPDGPGAAIP